MNNKKAFTIFEVILSVALIGIISAVVLTVASGGNRSRKQVEAAAREAAAAIREAQNYALNGKVINVGDRPCEYRFSTPDPDTASNASTYEIRYKQKNPATGTCTGSWTAIVSEQIDDNVVFSNAVEVSFDMPHAQRSGGANPIDIQVTKNSITMHICECRSGKIIEKGTSACASSDCN